MSNIIFAICVGIVVGIAVFTVGMSWLEVMEVSDE
jgi:hypothetical protein